MPTPDKVTPFKSSAAPAATSTGPEPSAVALPLLTMPEVMLTPPLKALPPDKLKTPAPALTKDPVVAAKSPVRFKVVPATVTSKLVLAPPCNVTPRLDEAVAPE